MDLGYNIKALHKIGDTTAKKLSALGILTVGDLLFHLPFRYDDFSQIAQIKDLRAGMVANVVGHIEIIQNKRSPRRRMYITEALVNDGTENIRIVWFNQPFIAKTLKVGDLVSFAGKVDEDFSGLMMNSPAYEKMQVGGPVHTQGLIPIYHLTADVTNKQIRYLVSQVLKSDPLIPDWVPDEIINRNKLMSMHEAVRLIHFPKDLRDIESAKKRLAFNELFLLQIEAQLIRKEVAEKKADPIIFKEKETKEFVDALPFTLTDAQKKAAWEIIQDMGKDKPMTRLLEGDVGSGKTVVASLAMLNAALNGKQSALLVPTEILAEQHYRSIGKLFAGYPDIKISLLTSNNQITNFKTQSSKLKTTVKNQKINLIHDITHNSDIIIGTHALLQEKIEFNDLGLVIVDEQHRFGVEQRKTLIDKNNDLIPHLLSMTATPIPRSLALAMYGDLDISIIKQMPAGRKPIITSLVPEYKRDDAYRFLREEIKKGRQVFVVCPLIEESDNFGMKSVKAEFDKLKDRIFPDLTIGILHGKMKSKEKDSVMKNFLENKINILVSTSVIEVGVDVPNATVMMIEGADHFGLAQLHQFRGRVGRSDHQSYCLLFTENSGSRTLERLNAMTKYSDGFSLAKVDLQFRGPGEVYGTIQKGFPELKIASLFDYELMKLARDEAIAIINSDQNLIKYPELKKRLDYQANQVHLE